MLAIGVAGLAGPWMGQRWLTAGSAPDAHQGFDMPRAAGAIALVLLGLLLLGLPLWADTSGSALVAQVAGFFGAGALVFGGGHVVLPLLQSSVVPVGAVSSADFPAGYGAARCRPWLVPCSAFQLASARS